MGLPTIKPKDLEQVKMSTSIPKHLKQHFLEVVIHVLSIYKLKQAELPL